MNCVFCKGQPVGQYINADSTRFICTTCIQSYDMAGEDDYKFCYFSYDSFGDDIYWISLIFDDDKSVVVNIAERLIFISEHNSEVLTLNDTMPLFETLAEWEEQIRFLLTFS